MGDTLRYFKILSAICIGSCSLVVCGQEVVIQDPELELTFIKPEGWKLIDDHLNIYLLPPPAMDSIFSYESNYFKITYFEEPSASYLEEYSVVGGPLSAEEIKNRVRKGKDKVDGKEVEWIVYDSLDTANPKRVLSYNYSKHGQDIRLTGVAHRKEFYRYFRRFRKVARSFTSRRIH